MTAGRGALLDEKARHMEWVQSYRCVNRSTMYTMDQAVRVPGILGLTWFVAAALGSRPLRRPSGGLLVLSTFDTTRKAMQRALSTRGSPETM